MNSRLIQTKDFVLYQDAEKRPSAALPSSFGVAAYVQYASLLGISGAPAERDPRSWLAETLGIFEHPAKT